MGGDEVARDLQAAALPDKAGARLIGVGLASDDILVARRDAAGARGHALDLVGAGEQLDIGQIGLHARVDLEVAAVPVAPIALEQEVGIEFELVARAPLQRGRHRRAVRSEEHTSELQSLMRISYAAFCLKKKKTNNEAE